MSAVQQARSQKLGPFGSWPSPISAEQVAAGGVKLNSVAASDGEIWWLETRPAENGRAVIVSASVGDGSRDAGTVRDRLSDPWSARSRVHEYGGGAWWLGSKHLYFTSARDQRIYLLSRVTDSGEPTPITPEPPEANGWRYADGHEHPDGTFVVCVREDHHRVDIDGPESSTESNTGSSTEPNAGPNTESNTESNTEPKNTIAAVAVDGTAVSVIVEGADFYSAPRISPDGRWLSWVEWDHPNMPWQETTLRAAPLFGARSSQSSTSLVRLGNPQVVATDAAVHGANWTSDGRLVYSSDKTGFWNLYWWTEGTGGHLTDLGDAEIGSPPWVFGVQHWADLGDGRLAAIVTREAVDSLTVLSADGLLKPVAGIWPGGTFDGTTPVAIDSIAPATLAGKPAVAMIASTPTGLPAVTIVDADEGKSQVVRPPGVIEVDENWFSTPRSIWYNSNGRSTQAFFYQPATVGHDKTQAGEGPKPPLVVIGHGGPTAHNGPSLNLKIQYWTSRGFAVADVNYGGSTGFGVEYRNRLRHGWGVIDVDDCVNAALHLAGQGLVDDNRMAIRGSSSGGLTVLLSLLQCDRFAAGVSLYGVTDLTALANETHKFESRYNDWLVGPYPGRADLYQQRSPASRIGELKTPMLLMQGTEDAVVPPAQSEEVVAALAANRVPHVYVPFDGEGHGFRKAASLVTSLEVELWFYGRVFGFEPADEIVLPSHATALGLAPDEQPVDLGTS